MKYDIYATWELNKFCNFRCPYCYGPIADRTNRCLEGHVDIDKIVEAFNRTKKIWLIHMSGGEPFLHPHFIELCQGLTEQHYVSINTNLSSDLIYDFCEKIKPRRIRHIDCSLHIVERERLGLKDDFIKKFILLKEHKFGIFAHDIMWPPVLNRLEEIYDYFKTFNIFIKPVRFQGIYGGKSYPQSYTDEEQQKIMDYSQRAVSSWRKENNIQTTAQLWTGLQPSPGNDGCSKTEEQQTLRAEVLAGTLSFKGADCFAGKTYARIRYNGDVIRCASEKKKLGNVFEGKLDILDAPAICNAQICICHFEGESYCLGRPKKLSEISDN